MREPEASGVVLKLMGMPACHQALSQRRGAVKEKAMMGDHRLQIRMDDAQLVERERQGETAAYDRLFDRHYR